MKKLKVIGRIWGLCAPFSRCIVVILLLLLTVQVVDVVYPIIFGNIINAATHKNVNTFWKAVLLWAALGGIRLTIAFIREAYELKRLDYRLSEHLSRISMKKFFDISHGQHLLGHSIIKRTVIGKGEAAISGTVYMTIYDIVPTLLTVVLPLVMLWTRVPSLGLCVTGAIVFFTVYTVGYTSSFVPRLRKLDTLSNAATKKSGEVIHNADVVYANAQEHRVCDECNKENLVHGAFGQPLWFDFVKWFYGGQGVITISQTICIGYAGYLTYTDHITSGLLLTVIMWIQSALGTLNRISHIQRNLTKNFGPIDKYFKFLDYQPNVLMVENPVRLPRMDGHIEFRNVCFTHSPRVDDDMLDENNDAVGDTSEASENDSKQGKSTLDQVSFVLQAGKRYAFVGGSGAGKSTLVSLILRSFDPDSGSILIDGVDLRQLDYRELRRNIGLVPQDVSLFDGTLHYNVTFGLNGKATTVTPSELEHVAKLSRLSEFMPHLENGWATKIGERGIKLSGGQRQRVGIARALIKNPHVLIFDEATSSLDTENEARIRESIHEASAGKTTIIIAHRLATVRDADEILVFNEGHLVGQGTHDALLESNEHYQKLVSSQVILK